MLWYLKWPLFAVSATGHEAVGECSRRWQLDNKLATDLLAIQAMSQTLIFYVITTNEEVSKAYQLNFRLNAD